MWNQCDEITMILLKAPHYFSVTISFPVTESCRVPSNSCSARSELGLMQCDPQSWCAASLGSLFQLGPQGWPFCMVLCCSGEGKTESICNRFSYFLIRPFLSMWCIHSFCLILLFLRFSQWWHSWIVVSCSSYEGEQNQKWLVIALYSTHLFIF